MATWEENNFELSSTKVQKYSQETFEYVTGGKDICKCVKDLTELLEHGRCLGLKDVFWESLEISLRHKRHSHSREFGPEKPETRCILYSYQIVSRDLFFASNHRQFHTAPRLRAVRQHLQGEKFCL